MVSRWGMSQVIGPVAFRNGEEHPFLGKEMHEQREYSDETARIIDSEVQMFLLQADRRAVEVLTQHRDKLDSLTKALVDKESGRNRADHRGPRSTCRMRTQTAKESRTRANAA